MQETKPRTLLILRPPLSLEDVLYERHRFPGRIGRPVSLARHIDRWFLKRQLRNVARTVREDVLRGDAYQALRTRQTHDGLGRLIDLRVPVDPKPASVVEQFAIQAHDEKPDARVAYNVTKTAIHSVAVVVGPGNNVFAYDSHESGRSSLEGAIDALGSGCRQEEEGRALDAPSIFVIEGGPHA